MTVQTIPNIEAVLFTLLDAHPDLANVRVAGELPGKNAEQVSPWVKVTLLAATDVGGVEHLLDYLVQLDCYAGRDATPNGQTEAVRVSSTVRAVLAAARGSVVDGIVLTGVSVQGMARVPDPAFTPPRQRVALTIAIHAHG